MPHVGNFPEPGFPKPLSIHSSEFVPKEDTDQFTRDVGYLRNRGILTPQYYYAPVYLPHKATVTKLILYGYRDAEASSLILSLYSIDHVGTGAVMAEVNADWTTGFSSGYDDTITDPVIDNENYNYLLRLTLDPDAVEGNVQLVHAVIEWS